MSQPPGELAVIWSPLARGRLARPFEDAESTARAETDGGYADLLYSATADSDRAIIDAVAAIASIRGVSGSQIALAWLASKPVATAPLVGANKTSHIDDAVAALDLELDAAEINQLERAYTPRNDFQGIPQGHDEVLASVTSSAVQVVPGVVAAGVTLVHKKNDVSTVGATSADAELFDQLQQHHQGGPCLQSGWTDEIVQVDDFGTEPRWPALGADVVARTVIRSSMSYRLYTSEHGIGALNFYYDRPGAFTAVGNELSHSLATYAALIIDAAQRHEQFQSALASRDIIGQAKGVIMERFTVDAVRAFELLRKLSQDTNTPVSEVARRLIEADNPAT